MEGGNPIVTWISYGILGFVLAALAILALRSAWFFLSLLAIPLTDVLARRTRLGGVLRRWGERGPRYGSGFAADAPAQATPTEDPARRPSHVPAPVRRGAQLGAVIGAAPGIWLAARAALLTVRGGGSALGAAAEAALALGLVAGAGLLVGAALGALGGAAWAALRDRPR